MFGFFFLLSILKFQASRSLWRIQSTRHWWAIEFRNICLKWIASIDLFAWFIQIMRQKQWDLYEAVFQWIFRIPINKWPCIMRQKKVINSKTQNYSRKEKPLFWCIDENLFCLDLVEVAKALIEKGYTSQINRGDRWGDHSLIESASRGEYLLFID